MLLLLQQLFFGDEFPLAMGDDSDESCSSPITVDIYVSNDKTLGEVYMKDFISWTDYDGSDGSLHFDPSPTWTDDVENSRKFRLTETGSKVYSYRSKVTMGMSQTRVLNEPPYVTPKEDVVFDIPVDIVRPETDEEILMLSVLEMQGLLRSGSLTATELTQIALDALKKYDPEFNMLEVELEELAFEVATKADEMLAAKDYVSPIMGIPFAIKDTYDVKGYVTAYGSFEFLDNVITDAESPLVTYAVEALAVPLFKSTVPQLTWGYANYNGTVYSCLNGGFAAGAGGSGGSSIGSGAAVCLGVVPVAICEQTGSSCQAPAIANGISTVIPALGTFSREANGLYSMESDRPGLLCRDIMSCAVFYNYMRGTSPGDPQSRGVPFADPSKEDISNYTIGFSDNSDTTGWPEAWDTPLKGKRSNVVNALIDMGATVVQKPALEDFMEPTQLLKDYQASGVGSKWFAWFDWYWLNVEGFFESVFDYGGKNGTTYGPVWEGQNFNFDNGHHRQHIGASAYAYLDDLWIFGYVAEHAMYPMLQTLPDVVVHFAQSELNGAHNGGMIKRAGINTVHIPEFYWNTTSDEFVDWVGSRPIDYYNGTTISAAMITCESKKYEPVKAFAVCYQLQQALVPGGKLISPYIDIIHDALKTGEHDLDCPYNWTAKDPDYLEAYPPYLKEKVLSKMSNRGSIPTCGADTDGGCTGGTCSDIRYKYDISFKGKSPSGIPTYKFKYRPGVFGINHSTTYFGVIAQDLLVLAPDSVCQNKEDGYLRVDYSKIDVDFKMV